MKRAIALLISLCLLALAAAACSAGSPAAAPSPSPTQSAAIPFPDGAGLDRLDSYTLSLRVSFKGTQDGQALDTTDIYTRAVSQEPPVQFTTIQTTDDAGKPASFLRGWVGDVLYMRAGSEEPCTARIVSSDDRESFNPAALIPPILQGKEIGLETVNGVSARHYAANAGQGPGAQMSADVWIAEPAGYIVRYSMSLKGGEEYLGRGRTGEKTLSFEINDAGARKPVAVPAGCPPPVMDLPALPGAANLDRSLSRLSFTTPASLEEAAAFYKDQMKALGWSLEASSTPPESSQPQSGALNLPDLSKLKTKVPGLDLKKFLATLNPPAEAPLQQEGWMIFTRAQDQKSASISMRPEGAGLRVEIRIYQD